MATTAAQMLPLARTASPTQVDEVAEYLRDCYEERQAVYAIGGGTSLDYGLNAKTKGLGLELSGLRQVVDYPVRDMTITVEAGISLAQLDAILEKEGQRLAVDAAQAEQATLGGLIATNFSGPRRYGCGTIRDYVIGIQAVDGRGVRFKAGGRVVKNVAGYDFCKLLTGSLGTLAVITQVTLKLRPRVAASAWRVTSVRDWNQLETLLAQLINSQTTPTAIDFIRGPAWSGTPLAPWSNRSGAIGALLVGLEGTTPEVAWMSNCLHDEWRTQGQSESDVLDGSTAVDLWNRLTEFSTAGYASDGAAVLKGVVRPGQLVSYVQALSEVDPAGSLACHAGNGVVLARCPGLKPAELGRTLVGRLQPLTQAAGGSLIALVAPEGSDLTRQAQWGASGSDAAVMRSLKEQFDPRGILNPGRFVYGAMG